MEVESSVGFSGGRGHNKFALELALYLHTSGRMQRQPRGERVESTKRRCSMVSSSKKISLRLEKEVKVKVLVTQLCLTLCNPMDCSPPGSSVNRTFQARILPWVAISSSRGIFLTQRSNPRGKEAACTNFFTTEPPGKPHDSH